MIDVKTIQERIDALEAERLKFKGENQFALEENAKARQAVESQHADLTREWQQLQADGLLKDAGYAKAIAVLKDMLEPESK